MAKSPKITPIGILAYRGAQRSAVHGLTDLFETAARLAAERGPVDRSLVIRQYTNKDCRMDPATPLFALILPPCLTTPPRTPKNIPLSAWLIAQHRRGTRLCSVCAGAFLLAETGLLDGRRATTHWVLAEEFSRRFPNVQLDAAKLLIDEGDLLTAGGVMSWIDLGLRVIEQLLGPAVMLVTARMFLVDPADREQSYYSNPVPRLGHGDETILNVQNWLQKHCETKRSVAAMSRQAGLGERTFLRRFQSATGQTPTSYVQQLRVARAREWLEQSTQTIDNIAWKVGYEDPSAFRRIFQRTIGLSPRAYRQRFSVRRSG